MLFKYLYYGLRYFPVVDDNNMYGVYSLMSPLDALLRYKMYTARPFAVLLDVYVISRLWDNLAVILVLMILLHFASAFLLYRVFEKNNMKIGILLVLFFVLNPLGTDAAYWIAASSRIVAGLFFASLSLYLIMLLCKPGQGSPRRSVLIGAGYFLSSLLSFGFYEQVTAFSFIFSVLLIIVNFKKWPRLAMLGLTFANAGLTALYYYHFKDVGTVGVRGQLVREELLKHIRLVTDKYLTLLTHDFLSMLKHGITNGWEIITRDGSWLYLAAILVISAAAAVIYSNEDLQADWKKTVKRLLTGICLVIVPFAPFYVLSSIWISNRNTFISFIGLGLIIETLIYLVFKYIKGAWVIYVRGFLFGAAIFAFMLVNVAEVGDYKQVSEIDRKIVNNMAEQYAGTVSKPEKTYVFNTRSLYISTTGRHLVNCTGVDWAFTGAINSISRGRVNFGNVTPVKDGASVAVSMEKLRACPLFGVFEDLRVCSLKMIEETQKRYSLVEGNGQVFGKLEAMDDGTVVFTRSVDSVGDE